MNRINSKRTRETLLAISGLLAVSLTATSNVDGSELQVGRYQTVMMQPDEEQMDLLSAVVRLTVSEQINTVGQAITLLLDGSGYRLLSADLAQPYRALLFALPLPEAHRQLESISLRQALELLSGPTFPLVIDPVYRLISFELAETAASSESYACSSK